LIYLGVYPLFDSLNYCNDNCSKLESAFFSGTGNDDSYRWLFYLVQFYP